MALDAKVHGRVEEHARLSTLALRAFLTRDEPFYTSKSTDLEIAIQGSNEEKLVRLARKLYYDGIVTAREWTVPESVRREARALVGKTEEEVPTAKESGEAGESRSPGSASGNPPTAGGSIADVVPSEDVASLHGEELMAQIDTRQSRFGNNATMKPERDARWLELLWLKYRALLEQGKIAEAQLKLRELLDAYDRLYAQLIKEGKSGLAARTGNTVGSWLLTTGDYLAAKDVFSGGTEGGHTGGSSTKPGDTDPAIASLAGRAAARAGLGDTDGADKDLDAAIGLATKSNSPALPNLRIMRDHLHPGNGKQVGTSPASARSNSVAASGSIVDRMASLRGKMRSASELQHGCSSLEDAEGLWKGIIEDFRAFGRPEGDPELVEAQRDLAALLRVRGKTDEARAIEERLAASQTRSK